MMSDSLLRIERRMSEIQGRFEPRSISLSSKNVISATAPEAEEKIRKNVLKLEDTNGKKFSALLNEMIDGVATRQGVSPDLIRAVVRAESGGNPRAVSSKGALGLMQLMPGTARSLGVDALNPVENLEGGVRYLRSLAAKYGDLDRTLAAYNAGPGAVDRWHGVPPYPETRDYVQRIKKTLLNSPRN